MDLTSSFAPYIYEALESERAIERNRNRWLAELRAERRRERSPRHQRPAGSARPTLAPPGSLDNASSGS